MKFSHDRMLEELLISRLHEDGLARLFPYRINGSMQALQEIQFWKAYRNVRMMFPKSSNAEQDGGCP
jgi:hypothetical protein